MERICIWLLLQTSFCMTVAQLGINEEMCEVENLLPLTNRLNFTTTTPPSNGFQTVITSYSFTCCGMVTAWGAYITQATTSDVKTTTSRLTLEFQVWRRSEEGDGGGNSVGEGSCEYRLVGNNTVTSLTLNASTFISNVPLSERIGFQLGDVIGINVYPSNNQDISRNETLTQRSLDNVMGFTRSFGESSTDRTNQAEENIKPVPCNTISRLTLVPVITVNIEPTPCPQIPTTPPSTTVPPPPPSGDNPSGLSEEAIAGITISALVVVLLCTTITVVCLVFVCVKTTKKRRRPKQKTFGKARFIRSLYILPTRYKARSRGEKEDIVAGERTTASQDSGSVREEVVVVLEGAEQQEDANREADNDESYVNVTKVVTPIATPTHSTKKATPTHENKMEMKTEPDDALYENSPYARRRLPNHTTEDFQREQKEEEDENKELYVNQDEFKRPTSLEMHRKEEEENDNDLYVNTDQARKEFADLESAESPIYMNQSISTCTNKAYGVTRRSDKIEQLQQQMETKVEREREGGGEEGEGEGGEERGEDEYVYVEVTADSPEEEYTDMTKFDIHKFLKKSK